MYEAKPNTFIYTQPNELSAEDCAYIIDLFEKHEEDHRVGAVGLKEGMVVDRDVKRSMDVCIRDQPHWDKVDDILYESVTNTMAALPTRTGDHFTSDTFITQSFGIRRYDEDGGHYDWHIDSGRDRYALRQLVFLWYLSDVEEGGETEFSFQSVEVKPKAGTLLMFPPFWTHRHRSKPVQKGVKYIATTWVSYG